MFKRKILPIEEIASIVLEHDTTLLDAKVNFCAGYLQCLRDLELESKDASGFMAGGLQAIVGNLRTKYSKYKL